MNSEASRGVRSATFALLGQVCNLAVVALASILIPRLLGVEDFGKYSAATAVVSILFVVSTLGLPMVEIRLLPPLQMRGDFHALAQAASSLWSLRLIAAVVSAAVAGAWIASSGPTSQAALAAAVAIFALARFCYQSTRSLLVSLDRVAMYMVVEFVQSVSFVLFFLAGYLVAGLAMGFLAAAIANVLMVVPTLKAVRHKVDLQPAHFRRHWLRPIWSRGGWSWGGMIARALALYFPVWMVAHWAGPRPAAALGLAVQVLGLITMTGYSAIQGVLPILSRFQSRGENHRLFYWAAWISRLGVGAIGCLALVWALVGGEVIDWVLGSEFREAFLPITLILAAASINLGSLVANSLHFLRDRHVIWAANLVIATLVTLVVVLEAVSSESSMVAPRAAAGYLLAAMAFWIATHATIRLAYGASLQIRSSLAMMAPLLLVWPILSSPMELHFRMAAALATPLLLAAYALACGLFRIGEVRYLWNAMLKPSASH